MSAAFTSPDAWETARAVAVRTEATDTLLGVAADPRPDTLRIGPGPLHARLPDLDPDRWEFRIEGGGALAFGQPGPSLSVVPTGELYAWRGPFAAHLEPRVGVDAAPFGPVVDVVGSVGIRTPGFYARVGREPLHQGPARYGGLLATETAPSLPGFAVGGDGRIPGKADVLGRFGLSLAGGWLPGERRDVQRPAWLLLDARWAPVPWVEAGLARNAVFGGSEGGVARPIDWGQVLLPTNPHAEDDPDQSGADTDERAAWDVRITPPLGKWGVPLVDYVEVFIQHGGEDVIARRLGPVPWPSLGGSANVYGAEVAAKSWYVGGEWAVIEDDLYRWYVGHRVYHDGWTVNGQSLGHPWGGDQRTTTLRLGRATLEQPAFEARWLHVNRVLVADRVDDTVFVFPTAEVRDEFGLHGAYWLDRGGAVEVDAAAGPVSGRDFVPGADGIAWRLGASVRLRVR